MTCKPCLIPSLHLNLPLPGFSTHSAGPLFTPVPPSCMSISFLWVGVGGVGSSGSSNLVSAGASPLSHLHLAFPSPHLNLGWGVHPPSCLFTAGCDLGLVVSLFNLLWFRLSPSVPQGLVFFCPAVSLGS